VLRTQRLQDCAKGRGDDALDLVNKWAAIRSNVTRPNRATYRRRKEPLNGGDAGTPV
jgi:hypothetical protein